MASSVAGAANGPVAMARSTASRRVSDARGSGRAVASWSSAATRSDSCIAQVTVLVRLSDHPEAGVGGDADVGEAQDEGYGHVDQAASSAVTSHPYRSNANAR